MFNYNNNSKDSLIINDTIDPCKESKKRMVKKNEEAQGTFFKVFIGEFPVVGTHFRESIGIDLPYEATKIIVLEILREQVG